MLVAEELIRGGFPTAVPALISPAGSRAPFWEQHALAVSASLGAYPKSQPAILVGHSGAGPLLPAIRQKMDHPISGYIFADAGLPENGKSRLDLFNSPQAVDQFRQAAQDGQIPAWTSEDLCEVIPDDQIRERFASELRPLPLAVYEEPLPVFEGWPDAPCGYLRFGLNPAYELSVKRAEQEGFSIVQVPGEHFHMLVEPGEVAQALVDLSAGWRGAARYE